MSKQIALVMHHVPPRVPLDDYTFCNKPLIEVIDDLCDMAGLRYRIAGTTLHIEPDTPYTAFYTVSFPLGSRETQHQVHIVTDVLGGLDGGGSKNHSRTSLSSKALFDFWGELEQALRLILRGPLALPSQQGASFPPVAQIAGKPPQKPREKLLEKPREKLLEKTPFARKSLRLLGAPPKSRSRENLKSGSASLPMPLVPSPATTASQGPQAYAIHKQAGLISVYGTKRQQQLVHDYLSKLSYLTHIQVTIEAQILEVLLKKKHKRGIDWGWLGQHLQGKIQTKPTLDSSFVTFTLQRGGFSAALAAMEEFGHVRTLSNPRLTVLNNQPALMKVAKNEVFFRLEVDRVISSDNKPDIETTTSQMQTIPIGLVMLVQPCVDPQTRDITLSLRPSLSRVVEMRDDPAVSIRSDNKIHSYVPVVQMRELDSVLKVRSHETILMGGLMERSQQEERKGFPGVAKAAFFSDLLGAYEDTSLQSELVILLSVWLEDGAPPEVPFESSLDASLIVPSAGDKVDNGKPLRG